MQVLAQAKEQQRQAGASLVEKTRALAQLTEELEGVKVEMETRGSSMTDGAPLVSIKRALARVRREIGGMDVMIGVLQQGLLQAAVKDNSMHRYASSIAEKPEVDSNVGCSSHSTTSPPKQTTNEMQNQSRP